MLKKKVHIFQVVQWLAEKGRKEEKWREGREEQIILCRSGRKRGGGRVGRKRAESRYSAGQERGEMREGREEPIILCRH